jgi:hypothetical protein
VTHQAPVFGRRHKCILHRMGKLLLAIREAVAQNQYLVS